ncbi:MAG: LEA14-like dessication related protein [Saprospiraceae bacterium]|jgi:LEA14-like dessication related protein
MRKIVLLAVVVLSIFMTSCGYKEVTYSGVKNVELQSASLSEIKLKITVRVNNPNSYKITLVNGEFNVKSDDFDLGTFHLTEKTVIPAESEGDVDVFVHTKLKSLFSSATMALMAKVQQNKIPVTIDGHITAKAYFLRKKIKFNKTENVSL